MDNENINKIIGAKIKALRENKGEYQKETAAAISAMGESLSEGQLGLYETGIRKTPPNIIRALAIHFKVSSDFILGIDSKHTPIALSPVDKMLTEMEQEDREKIVEYAEMMYQKYKNKK
ncbi:MAG: helix-turn-helix transcriptional regulator [Clostridia bacterium]